MPIAGRKPKAEHRHRVKPVQEWMEVPDVPFEDAPKLPVEFDWPKGTLRWWKAVSTMPHCVLWDESDWQFAIDTAYVAAAFHKGDVKAATELRNREKVLGTTIDYRRDLRIRYVEPEAEEVSVADQAVDEYKMRLVK